MSYKLLMKTILLLAFLIISSAHAIERGGATSGGGGNGAATILRDDEGKIFITCPGYAQTVCRIDACEIAVDINDPIKRATFLSEICDTLTAAPLEFK